MSESNSTRNPDPDVYREHARASIEAARAGADVTTKQLTAIARIRVRMHARANRHELGEWQLAPTAGAEHVACIHCGARAYLVHATATENVDELFARRCS